MHTSISRGNVLCKNQSCPVLPQSARAVTEEEDEEEEEEEEEEDDDEKLEICVRQNFARLERRRYVLVCKALLQL